jgi:hypothetical protein
MSIRKPFCAIGLIFFDLKFAVFSTWQAILQRFDCAQRRLAKDEWASGKLKMFYRQETDIQWQETGKKLSQG